MPMFMLHKWEIRSVKRKLADFSVADCQICKRRTANEDVATLDCWSEANVLWSVGFVDEEYPSRC